MELKIERLVKLLFVLLTIFCIVAFYSISSKSKNLDKENVQVDKTEDKEEKIRKLEEKLKELESKNQKTVFDLPVIEGIDIDKKRLKISDYEKKDEIEVFILKDKKTGKELLFVYKQNELVTIQLLN